MQRFADKMQHPIYITETKESGAVGAAIFGAIAGNAFDNVHDTVAIMSLPALEKHIYVVEPNLGRKVKLYWDNMQEQYYRLGRLEMELYGRENIEEKGVWKNGIKYTSYNIIIQKLIFS